MCAAVVARRVFFSPPLERRGVDWRGKREECRAGGSDDDYILMDRSGEMMLSVVLHWVSLNDAGLLSLLRQRYRRGAIMRCGNFAVRWCSGRFGLIRCFFVLYTCLFENIYT